MYCVGLQKCVILVLILWLHDSLESPYATLGVLFIALLTVYLAEQA